MEGGLLRISFGEQKGDESPRNPSWKKAFLKKRRRTELKRSVQRKWLKKSASKNKIKIRRGEAVAPKTPIRTIEFRSEEG